MPAVKAAAYVMVLFLAGSLLFCGKKGGSSTGSKTPGDAKIRAMITFAKGSVQLERNGVSAPARVNDILRASDVIRTGKNGGADLMLQDYGVVKLGKDSRLKILSLVKNIKDSSAEFKLDRGEAASFITRKRRGARFKVVTPTAIAGVRGTVFLTEVERLKPGSKKKSPRVKVAVFDGSVAVNLPGQKEVILHKNSQLVIDGFQKLTRDMVKVLDPASLRQIKRLAVFHKTNVLEFNSMVDDIRSSNKTLLSLEGGSVKEQMKARERKISKAHQTEDSVARAEKTDEARYLKREVNQEHIKLKPNSSFQK